MRRSLTAAAIVAAFAYGLAAGHFAIFPFGLLQSVKQVVGFNPAQSAQPSPDPVTWITAERRVQFSAFEPQADVVMLGDSLTWLGDWNAMFPGVRLLNRGISGDTTAGLLARLDDVLATKPRLVVLMAGVNDAQQHVTTKVTLANYRAIVGHLHDTGAEVVAESVIPTSVASVDALNDGIRAICAAGACRFLDVSSLARFEREDRVHLNAAGYVAWRELLVPIITQLELTP